MCLKMVEEFLMMVDRSGKEGGWSKQRERRRRKHEELGIFRFNFSLVYFFVYILIIFICKLVLIYESL